MAFEASLFAFLVVKAYWACETFCQTVWAAGLAKSLAFDALESVHGQSVPTGAFNTIVRVNAAIAAGGAWKPSGVDVKKASADRRNNKLGGDWGYRTNRGFQ